MYSVNYVSCVLQQNKEVRLFTHILSCNTGETACTTTMEKIALWITDSYGHNLKQKNLYYTDESMNAYWNIKGKFCSALPDPEH